MCILTAPHLPPDFSIRIWELSAGRCSHIEYFYSTKRIRECSKRSTSVWWNIQFWKLWWYRAPFGCHLWYCSIYQWLYSLQTESKTRFCVECCNLLEDPSNTSLLITMKNKGDLCIPHEEVVDVCCSMEGFIRLNPDVIFLPNFFDAAFQYLPDSLPQHSEDHNDVLKRLIGSQYLKIRLHHESNFLSACDKYIRKISTKLVTYCHQ